MKHAGSNGFSLVELVIVVTVLSIILAVGLARYSGFNRREQLRQSALNFKTVLRLAQAKAISAEKPSSGCTTFAGMRLTFTYSTYSMWHQCDPEGLVGTSVDYTLPDGISFSPIPGAFRFMPRTNTTNLGADRSFTMSNGTEWYTIIVSPNGNIEDAGMQ